MDCEVKSGHKHHFYFQIGRKVVIWRSVCDTDGKRVLRLVVDNDVSAYYILYSNGIGGFNERFMVCREP